MAGNKEKFWPKKENILLRTFVRVTGEQGGGHDKVTRRRKINGMCVCPENTVHAASLCHLLAGGLWGVSGGGCCVGGLMGVMVAEEKL